MKRLKIILTCLLLLIVAVHPVVALHHCKGLLADVSLSAETSCPCGIQTFHDTAAQTLDKDCCRTTSLQLTSGDYLRCDMPTTPHPLVFPFITVFPPIDGTAALLPTSANAFSPHGYTKGPPFTGRTVLKQCCTLLI